MKKVISCISRNYSHKNLGKYDDIPYKRLIESDARHNESTTALSDENEPILGKCRRQSSAATLAKLMEQYSEQKVRKIDLKNEDPCDSSATKQVSEISLL